MRFEGRTVVITGACGEIGSATAVRILDEGGRVFLVDRDPDVVAGKVEELAGESRNRVAGLAADVTDGEAVAGYAAAAAEFAGGKVEGFYNNAGIEGPVGLVQDIADDAFDEIVAVNLRGVFLGLKHMVPRMSRGGAIVNAGSISGLGGAPRFSPYVATKHAVIGMTRSVALETAPAEVRVNAVCPGPIAGRMIAAIEAGYDDPEAHERLIAGVPLGRYGQVTEVASVVTYLLSPDSNYVTGSCFVVDGGLTAPS